ncbi:PepSY domain-containing protein [Ruegeria sp. HKCCA6837]|uniref:PepSY-associated TM helix domain-containing protein n=1 Tax=Ruegeria sp. HKCCA6837 TaxID=2682989 RepID=UPI001488EA86|nr:PepSY-associated TM helix domain-containing protein [Ruegeria sp. HKCCA6837]
MNRKIRNTLFKFHTWLGLHLSLFFTFMFLTGTLLVAGFELESVGRSGIWTTMAKEERTASFGMTYDGIKEAHPESGIFLIIKRPTPWFVDRAFGRAGWGERMSFWTDPVTGTVVEATRPLGFRDILRALHDTLLTEQRVVFMLICATSAVLLFQIISGLITYRRFWRGFFRWPSGSGGLRSWSGGAHRLTAVWTAPLLILIAVTSLYFLLGSLGIESAQPQPEPPTPRDSALPANFNSALIDQAEARARAALPGFEPSIMFLPGKKTDSLRFSGPVDGYSGFFGSGSVSIDPVTLEVLGAFTPDDIHGYASWKPLMSMLHFGTWGGGFSMALWIVLGLLATGLAFTGALIFAARQAPDRAHRGPLRKIWRGMGWTRWGYLLLLAGILVTAFYRFGPNSHDKTRAFPINEAPLVARLVMEAPLRRGVPLDIEMLIGEPDVQTAAIEINGDMAELLDFTKNGDTAKAYFQLTPSDTENNITARLRKPDDQEKVVKFRLGAPLW